MIPPLLKLAFVQGPREGDSLEYKPGSTIRIGRILRGNEIAIKDAGISTKHLRIVSDSEHWIIHDLGSSNGTILNSDTLDPDTPVSLRDGDVIKLGEYTSIVVNFVTDVQVQEHKLPPRPRRNNRRLADPDPDPIDSVQEKPTRKGRSSKQDEHELPKRTRATRSRTVEDTADNEKASEEVENEKEVNSRVSRSRKQEKKVAMTNAVQEEEAPEEKKGSFRARGGKNTESVHNLGLNSIKLETEDIPKGVEISAMERATRSKQIENVKNLKSEDTVLEEKDEKRTLRSTRSKKKEIVGDSFMELEMVLNQARKSRAKKKKIGKKPTKTVEARNDDVEENEGCSERSDKEDKTSKSKTGAEDINCTVREDGETENLQDKIEEENDEQETSNKKVEVDLEKMTLGEWFKFMEVQLRKQIVEETEKMIEEMRSKSLRVHKYIEEQKQAKGKASAS